MLQHNTNYVHGAVSPVPLRNSPTPRGKQVGLLHESQKDFSRDTGGTQEEKARHKWGCEKRCRFAVLRIRRHISTHLRIFRSTPDRSTYV